MDTIPFQRYISDITASGTEGLERLLYGSYSERNPGLGRMVTCPHCRQRRRELITEPCCNTSHATSKRAYDSTPVEKSGREKFEPQAKGFYQEPCLPRVTEFSIKKFVKKLNHARPAPTNMGLRTRLQIHAIALEMQNEAFRNTTHLLLEGLPGFHEPSKTVGVEAIPTLAGRFVMARRKAQSNRRRKAQQLARRVNFG